MENIKVFYSWQSDYKNNKNSIEKCIKNVSKKFFNGEIILDRDTLGHSGSPDILQVLLEKVEKSDIFIADVSIINKDFNGKKVPNPNVMFELGYATAFLKKDYTILLFNEETGVITDLPFDIDHRRVLGFKLDNLQGLEKKLEANFKNILQNFNKRELARKARLKNLAEKEKETLKEFLKEYNRAAFYAPFQQEDSVRMYESINQAKINYQKMKVSVSDNEVQKSIDEFVMLIQNAIKTIREKHPIIDKLSKEIMIPLDNELRASKILTSEQTNYVLNLLYNLRENLKPHLEKIQEYYNSI